MQSTGGYFSGDFDTANLRIAIVHDQLYTIGGAEKVLKRICEMLPRADVFALYNTLGEADLRYIMGDRKPKLSLLQRLPFVKKLRRAYFFLMPLAVEQLDVRGYDLVISSSYLVAKGILVGPDQAHICYIHSPMRYAWDQQTVYLKQIRSFVGRNCARLMLHYMRSWDARSANGVDVFLANSRFVARRTAKAYRRKAKVLYPPVDLRVYSEARISERRPDTFATMSRLVEGKRIDLLIDAFRELPDCRLEIIGEGDLRESLEARAPANVTFLGRLSDVAAAKRIASATAFVYAAEEDFGISPVEAQAAGTPVVAYHAGGTAETVRGLQRFPTEPTGVFFERQTPSDLAAAVQILRQNLEAFDPEACRRNAARFSVRRFEEGLLREIERVMRARSSEGGTMNVTGQVLEVA